MCGFSFPLSPLFGFWKVPKIFVQTKQAKNILFNLPKGKAKSTVALAMKSSSFASCQQSWHLFNPMPNAHSMEIFFLYQILSLIKLCQLELLTEWCSWLREIIYLEQFKDLNLTKIGNFLERGLHSYHTFVDFGMKIGSMNIETFIIELEKASFVIFDHHCFCPVVHSYPLNLDGPRRPKITQRM